MTTVEPTFRRQPPGRLLRLFFRVPVLLYRGWLAELFGRRCVMLVTTTGRRSGRPRTVGVSFMPLDDRIIAFAGFGVRSNWYQNLLVNPAALIQIGRRRRRAMARPVLDPDRRQALMRLMRQRSGDCGPPRLVRPLLRLTRVFDYDGEIALAVEHARDLPVVEFLPHGEP